MRSTSFSAQFNSLLGFLLVASAVAPAASFAQEEVSIRRESDYEKHGFPKLGDDYWTEKDNYAALAAAQKLAKVAPKFLPSLGDRTSGKYFYRMTNLKHLENSGPTGEKYFTALEKLYLEFGKTDPQKFERDIPRIQDARLRYTIKQLNWRPDDNENIADAVFSSLMAWSRIRCDLDSAYSDTFDVNMRGTESGLIIVLKRMPPKSQEKVLLKLDAIATAYPDAAKKQKITPDLMEKLLKSLDIRPEKLKAKMVAAKAPDLKKTWGLVELKEAVTWLRREAEIDKTKMPRMDSEFLKKMLAPDTLKSVVRAEDSATQLASTLVTTRSQYLLAVQAYRVAGFKDYVQEAGTLLQTFYDLWWIDIQRFQALKRKTFSRGEDFLAKQFNGTAVTFCAWTLNDAALARGAFNRKFADEFRAYAVKHYPQVFRMMSETSRKQAAEYLFIYRKGTEERLSVVRGEEKVGLAKQKKMIDEIEAAIRPLIPEGVPRDRHGK